MPNLSIYPGQLDIPFLKVPGLSVSSSEPQLWASMIRQVMPVRICEPLRNGRPFRNLTAVANLGGLTATATHGSAISLSSDEQSVAMLLLPYRGSGRWTTDGRQYEVPVGETVLYLPPSAVQLENTITSGVGLNMEPDKLLATALSMAGPDGIGRDLAQACYQPQLLSWKQRAEQELIWTIYRTLQAADQAMRVALGAVPLLRFDDLLMRLTLLLLIPELRQVEPVAQPVGLVPAGGVQLGHLVDWIEANLSKPLSLSDLERQAHCSRRTLQYHFRRRYGCSPMQWLRRRRLQRALERLRTPAQPKESVWEIAQSCGYTSLAAFSRDFKAMHGLRPSDVRQGASG